MNEIEIKQKILSRCLPNSNDCLIYQGKLEKNGYAKITINYKTYWLHRLILFIKNNKWPDHTDHTCNNRACLNENHLEDVTQAENNRRMFARMNKPLRQWCKKGHDLKDDNLYIGVDGRRRCKICKNKKQNERRLLYGRK